jgi:hypothetical protein
MPRGLLVAAATSRAQDSTPQFLRSRPIESIVSFKGLARIANHHAGIERREATT